MRSLADQRRSLARLMAADWQDCLVAKNLGAPAMNIASLQAALRHFADERD